jgi:hypothetical protein
MFLGAADASLSDFALEAELEHFVTCDLVERTAARQDHFQLTTRNACLARTAPRFPFLT